jgi:hypothetical protein
MSSKAAAGYWASLKSARIFLSLLSMPYCVMGSHPEPTDWTALRRLCADLREVYTELADMLRAEGPFMSHDAAQKFSAKEAEAKALRTQIEMIEARWPLSD